MGAPFAQARQTFIIASEWMAEDSERLRLFQSKRKPLFNKTWLITFLRSLALKSKESGPRQLEKKKRPFPEVVFPKHKLILCWKEWSRAISFNTSAKPRQQVMRHCEVHDLPCQWLLNWCQFTDLSYYFHFYLWPSFFRSKRLSGQCPGSKVLFTNDIQRCFFPVNLIQTLVFHSLDIFCLG